MNKHELLECLDEELLGKLFSFSYARSKDSVEAQELCSDIIFALVKAAQTEGEIQNPYAFVWQVTKNVYAQFSTARRKWANTFYEGDAEADIFPLLADKPKDDDDAELLDAIYQQISFLTRAYREVMILFYLDGLSIREIALRQHTSEGAIRQRLYSARQKVKNEVEKMQKAPNRPLSFDQIDFVIWGNGNPGWGDPRKTCTRMFSRHIIWLCRQKPMSASEIAERLNVPTVYVEEELEILAKGANGQYGLLRRMDSGRYAINFILMDQSAMEEAHSLYQERIPAVCDAIAAYVQRHQQEYLSFPYLNRKVDMNLILWQQIIVLADAFANAVERVMSEKYFSQVRKSERPFSVYGYLDDGKYYGGVGCDGVNAENLCGFSKVHIENIYNQQIQAHFHCDFNVSCDPQIQLALRAIKGLPLSALSEAEKEHAAKAVESGYLYREGDALYTKILVNDMRDRAFDISFRLPESVFEKDAQVVAEKIAALIKREVPEYLLEEWQMANYLANLPIREGVVQTLIQRGLLTPPEDGIGAEGCWMSVMK